MAKKIKKSSSEYQLYKIMEDTREEMSIDEGFFDDFTKSYRRQTHEKNRMGKSKRKLQIQREKENSRMSYVRKGLPVPANLSKESLRQYYETNNLTVPGFLQGEEGEDKDTRAPSTSTGANRTEEKIKEKTVDFLSDKLGVHPNARDSLEGVLKGVSFTSIGAAVGGIYKALTGTNILPKNAKNALPEIENAVEQAVKETDEDELSSYGSTQMIAGVFSDSKMYYIFTKNFMQFAYNKGQKNSGDPEQDAKEFVKSYVEPDVLNSSRSDVVANRFPTGARLPWSRISSNIKKDKTNDKKNMGYQSGHFVVSKDESGKLELIPISEIENIRIGELQ